MHASQAIRDNELAPFGIPASIRFDRIEVSNIIDCNYVGINDVLTSWAPLLAESNYATILSYLMNWVVFQPDGSASSAGQGVLMKLLNRLVQDGRVSVKCFPGHWPLTIPRSPKCRALDKAKYVKSSPSMRTLVP
jgi:hypothetical protein